MRAWNTRFAGKEAFRTKHNRGYLFGEVDNIQLLAHRVVWALYYGQWPSDEIDHINRVRADNRIENLRAVSHAENTKNISKRNGSTSSYLGVSWDNSRGAWSARVTHNGRQLSAGRFDDEIQAAKARDRLLTKLSKGSPFVNLNFPPMGGRG
jgi:hypothetical protein